ncbi:MAG: 50S ribosomal protein L32, partial [Deltaproteobacteria bacterium]|nr:50S ribosomal protein L32 [Deltaproteobacteria bacterium]
MQLRPYQQDGLQDIHDAWDSGARNVLYVLPTGAGKTVIFSHILAAHEGRCVAIAHRQELVGQISMALAHRKVYHRIIGPVSVVKYIVKLHMDEVGRSYFNPDANCAVAGVDTLVRRQDKIANWLKSATLWVQDEAHHILTKNKWGTATTLMPNAKGLGVTATPLRADGNGLGREYDGVFDQMVVGPGMRDIINDGYLTEYRVFCPRTEDLNLSTVPITGTGDYSKPKLRAAVRESRIIGDVVSHYLKIAPGRLGITFCTDVKTATDVAERFQGAGVPAQVISHKTPDRERSRILRQFRAREVMQLVNVDLFGEGFDLPAIEVVSFARPTESYGVYVQQFGRGLRILEGKPYAIIIDHVGNVIRHGLPDKPRAWTLARRDRKEQSKEGEIPLRACPECTQPYERIHRVCPYCGYYAEPESRSAPKNVDGDLHELDAATLEQMRGAVAAVDRSLGTYRAWLIARDSTRMQINVNLKRHAAAQQIQEALRGCMNWWALQRGFGSLEDSEIQRRFYYRFGIDVLSAKALKYKDAAELAVR